MKKAIPFLGLAVSIIAGFAFDTQQAKAFVVNISGIDYNVTTFEGSPAADLTKFNTPANGGTMPWWGDDALALEFATAVGAALGSTNGTNIPISVGFFDPANTVTGPFFATLAGEPVFAAFYNFNTSAVEFFTDFDYFTAYTYAEVLPSPPPSSVPGPLPLFGSAAAFAHSRRLRRRIKLGS